MNKLLGLSLSYQKINKNSTTLHKFHLYVWV